MSDKRPVYNAACHCGAVQMRLHLSDGFNTIRRCDCSYCRMRGAVAVSAQLEDIEITAGADHMTLYQWGTGTAKHYFCSICGIYTHHQRRSNPQQYGVNVACIEGVSPFDFPEVPVMDGLSHPTDSGAARRAGTLRYEPTPKS